MTIDYEHLLGKAYSTYKFAPLLQAVARIEEPFDIRQMLIFALSVAMDNEHSLLPWLIEENAECIQRMEGGMLEAEVAGAIRRLVRGVQIMKAKEKAATCEDGSLSLNSTTH